MTRPDMASAVRAVAHYTCTPTEKALEIHQEDFIEPGRNGV